MLTSKEANKAYASVLILLFILGLTVGGLLLYFVAYRLPTGQNSQISQLQSESANFAASKTPPPNSINIYQNSTSLSDIYSAVRPSIVLVQGDTNDGWPRVWLYL